MSNLYKKGNVIYKPSANWTPQPKPCPVCNGTTKILVKALGAPDAQGEEMFCEYCRWAERDGLKRGYVVEEWAFAPHVQKIIIEGVEQLDRPGKKEVKYLYNCTSCSWSSVIHEEVYADPAIAMQVAVEMGAKARHGQDAKDHPNPSYSIGYCRSQINKAKKETETEIKRWQACMKKARP